MNFKKHFGTNSKILLIALFILFTGTTYFAVNFWSPKASQGTDNKTLSFYAIDVGQGDSFAFFLPDGKTILIDAGPEDAGKKVVSFLKDRGVNKIDLLVATHGHSDHIGGMHKVLRNFEIGKVWDSGFNHGSRIQRALYKIIKKKDIPFGRPKRGYAEQFGDVNVEVIAPTILLRNTRSDANNNCLVLKITYGEISFLMTADMEREQRATVQPLPHATILKASHHGSYNGTDTRVLREVQPSIIILSYGKNNSYGYPHKSVIKIIKKEGIPRYDTADGTFKIETDGSEMKISRNSVNYDK